MGVWLLARQVAPALVRQAARLEVRLWLRPRAGTRGKLAQKPCVACANTALLRRYDAACRRLIQPTTGVTEEIARNISDVCDLSTEAAQTSEQSTQASRHLSELSSGLAWLVGRFRV